jgi:homoserine acetyltransferase
MRSLCCLEPVSRKTILATSVHSRAHQQVGRMAASDLIKALQNTLRGGGRPHTGLGLCAEVLRATGVSTTLMLLWPGSPRII